ncbi:MAG TPA: type II toxin-antitoxin system VapC family toxin [Longimicrobiaceae bacterium]|nr:type II toxin-antitoxin system VapC family toxin [Longimicrobiaceae bacterium]
MKQWLVDTNVLLDVIGADPIFGERSKACLEICAASGVLVINPVIYAEAAAFIESIEALDELIPPDLFRRDPLPWSASFLAGKAYSRYRSRGGKRRRILADFLIGAHATVAGFGLVSRDQGYSRYFELQILDPGRQ